MQCCCDGVAVETTDIARRPPSLGNEEVRIEPDDSAAVECLAPVEGTQQVKRVGRSKGLDVRHAHAPLLRHLDGQRVLEAFDHHRIETDVLSLSTGSCRRRMPPF